MERIETFLQGGPSCGSPRADYPLKLWIRNRFGALGKTRTSNLLIRSQMLYPLSYERFQR